MTIVLELLICLIVVLTVVFLAGKKIGERQYLKTREEMKALELSFNQLLEQMELVSNHNLKLMATKTSELQELLPIIDKKALYVRDLLDEVEEKNSLKGSSPIPTGIPEHAEPDPRLERRIEDLRAMVMTRLQGLENQLSHLAGEWKRTVAPLAESLPSTVDLEQIPHLQREIERISADCRRLNSFRREFEQLASALEPSPIPPELLETALPETSLPASPNDATVFPASAQGSTPSPEPTPEPAPILPRPGLSAQQQSRSHEILDLVGQGVTIPQIARRLCMVPGEVELIINIYGPKPAARRSTYR